jgi:hypothetical protein
MLYDNPPHRISLSSSVNANQGAGVVTTYTVVQSAVPCLINTASASTRNVFAQMNIVVTNTVGILSSDLTTTPKPGWKVVVDDTGQTFLIQGIRSGRESALGTIPALTYLDCSLWLE